MYDIYLAGPMSGYKNKNFPAFRKAKKQLRKAGYKVCSPEELDVNQPRSSWEDCLRRDIKELVKCNGIATLKGWEKSKGANLEIHIGRSLGMAVNSVADWLRLG